MNTFNKSFCYKSACFSALIVANLCLAWLTPAEAKLKPELLNEPAVILPKSGLQRKMLETLLLQNDSVMSITAMRAMVAEASQKAKKERHIDFIDADPSSNWMDQLLQDVR